MPQPARVAPDVSPPGKPAASVLHTQEWREFEPFLVLAGIESQLASLAERLREIIQKVENSLPGASVRLLCLDGSAAEPLSNGVIGVLEAAELEATPHLRAALSRDATQFATSAPEDAAAESGQISAAVPLHVDARTWGLLEITWQPSSVTSIRELALLLTPVARFVEIAIQNQTTLEKLVFIDPLTGVYNRAFYERQVTLEIERAHRTNGRFALLVMDIDDFKDINDRFGHRAGDLILTEVAQAVRARMRKIDLMFRYGGDEFVLLLPGADVEEAQRTAERLIHVVKTLQLQFDGAQHALHVTVSFGAAVYPDQSRTQSGIFQTADHALLEAKRQGKNRVVAA